MAWGLFNKIKKCFKKVGSAFKKGLNFVNDKIVKPFKPIIKAGVNALVPGAGAIVDVASDGLDALSKGDYQKVVQLASDKWRQNNSSNNSRFNK